ncbi:MAG: DUF5107 domain-containing protein [Lachnospiraceae bacterium]|nr:DUF5107 domain-containing protein [Lachnospiraceae bacterium]
MSEARVWEQKVVIPTYGIGAAEKNPMFLEKRVYQGSSGRVYPYPTIESICDEKEDREYNAVMLENEYLKVMVLPQLGGRIQRAYDKTNGYDFVYYNHVIKPALVGLTGPWISGGIEFNWPQHHRPTTFLPVDYVLEQGEERAAVLLNDVDRMYGTKVITKIALYPGWAYIEITGQLYNRTALPQTFLWWANPAVAVNDRTQSIFPPDVHAVMDHGKRDVSRFPVATGVYYKKDYSEGVDISRYKNIPVPTSYMAQKSRYDFVGGYDYGREAGLLHVADHLVSPGKKQWTWGCGDFGQAWDRNLTDEDGSYIELMTGVYTDNQPDFTWLKPFEEKSFCQYFMPYKAAGQVKNATKEAVVSLSRENGCAKVVVYATGSYPEAVVQLSVETEQDCAEAFAAGVRQADRSVRLDDNAALCGSALLREHPQAGAERILFEEKTVLSPTHVFEREICLVGAEKGRLCLTVLSGEKELVCYREEREEIPELPEPAQAAKAPENIMTNEELYLTGQHLEQYRHATFLPDPYYLEGLKRDSGDIRINTAYGRLLLSRGQFAQAEEYFRQALKRLTWKNPNPYHSETYYLLGLTLLYRAGSEFSGGGGKAFSWRREAYENFYKAAWSAEQQEKAYYYVAALDAREGKWALALEHAERSLVRNAHNIKARGLKAYLLRKLGRKEDALRWGRENLALDPFDLVSCREAVLYGTLAEEEFERRLGNSPESYLLAARDYAEFGAFEEACGLLNACRAAHPMIKYYQALYTARWQEGNRLPKENGSPAHPSVKELLSQAEAIASDYCFPNKLDDIAVLRFAIEHGCKKRASYYLGNLFYDKLQWQEAVSLWETARQEDGGFATVHRNLAIAYYNKLQDKERAKKELELAFALDPSDARVFLELDQLYKKLGVSSGKRLTNYEAHPALAEKRDDLYVEYVTLLNATGAYGKALKCMMGRRFHPWEGGEGKITAQYTLALLQLAKEKMREEAYEKAEELLRSAFFYPENLGEGKLEGTKDNHLYYHLGLCLSLQGKQEEARECFLRATKGTDEPAGAMYYNDQPAEMILYQGLAWNRLFEGAKAKARFYRLVDYGEKHLYDDVRVDYFAVSLPDFLIFDEDCTKKNRAHCYYLMGLGNLGLGDREKAEKFFTEAVRIDPAFLDGRYGIDVFAETGCFL